MLELSTLLKALFLGVIEGLTEFIPVSSTAHLLIASYMINFDAVRNSVFEISIQIGAILAICIIYRKKIFEIIFNINEPQSQKFSLNLFLAFLPSVVIGLIFHQDIKNLFFSNTSIAIALIIGGIIMIIVESINRQSNINNINDISFKLAFTIGLCQCLAMIPGVSRSGATIIGALYCGFDRKTATEFSFFLAIPTISSACIYDIFKNFSSLSFDDFELILLGSIASFITAILVIKWFLKFVSKYNFICFGIYRILIGGLVLLYLT